MMKKRVGWANQSKRHSNAKKYGVAGGKYATPKKRFKSSVLLNRRGEKIDSRVPVLIDRINENAFVPMENNQFTTNLMDERMTEDNYNNKVWSNLVIGDSGNLFKKPNIDASIPVVFVDIYFALGHRGNPLEKSNVDEIKKVIKKGDKLDAVPIFDVSSNVIEEGNHRVQALYDLGYRSVPVRIDGGWN